MVSKVTEVIRRIKASAAEFKFKYLLALAFLGPNSIMRSRAQIDSQQERIPVSKFNQRKSLFCTTKVETKQ